MKPANAAGENRLPIEIARLQPRRRFVRSVVEDYRRADAVAAIAVNCCDIRASNAVVVEALVERFNAHRLYTLGHQIADRIVDDGGSNAGLQSETVSQIGCNVELAAA